VLAQHPRRLAGSAACWRARVRAAAICNGAQYFAPPVFALIWFTNAYNVKDRPSSESAIP
jgi:hypothetical protein